MRGKRLSVSVLSTRFQCFEFGPLASFLLLRATHMKTPPKLDHERVSDFSCHPLENSLFGQGVLEFLMGENMSLVNRFHREEAFSWRVTNEKDL